MIGRIRRDSISNAASAVTSRLNAIRFSKLYPWPHQVTFRLVGYSEAIHLAVLSAWTCARGSGDKQRTRTSVSRNRLAESSGLSAKIAFGAPYQIPPIPDMMAFV